MIITKKIEITTKPLKSRLNFFYGKGNEVITLFIVKQNPYKAPRLKVIFLKNF